MWRVLGLIGLCVLAHGCGRVDLSQDTVNGEVSEPFEVGAWRAPSLPEASPKPKEIKDPKMSPKPMEVEEPEVKTPERLGACPMEMAWWSAQDVHQYASKDFSFTKDQRALIVPAGSPWSTALSFYNGSTGQAMYSSNRADAFERAFFSHGVHVKVGKDRTTIFVHKDGGASSFEVSGEHFRLSKDQSTLATVSCSKEGPGVLKVWDVASEEEAFSQELPLWACASHWDRSLKMVVRQDGRAVAFYGLQRGDQSQTLLAHVVVLTKGRSGVWETHRAMSISGVTQGASEMPANLIFHQDTDNLSVINHKGERVVYDVMARDVVHQEQRGAFVANFDTYDYSRPSSPLAWSNHTGVEASVNMEGEVELRDSFGGEILGTLVLNEKGHPNDFAPTPLPIDLAFSDDGTHLAVKYRQGVGMWRCVGSDLPKAKPGGIEDLRVQVTSTVHKEGVSMLVKAAVQNRLPGRAFGYRIRLDGKWIKPYVVDGGFRFYKPGSPEPTELVVEADDGHVVLRHESTFTPGSP